MNIEKGSKRVGITGGVLLSFVVFFLMLVPEYMSNPSQKTIIFCTLFALPWFLPGYYLFKGLVKLIFWIIDGFTIQEG
jgi:hypothetical protein